MHPHQRRGTDRFRYCCRSSFVATSFGNRSRRIPTTCHPTILLAGRCVAIKADLPLPPLAKQRNHFDVRIAKESLNLLLFGSRNFTPIRKGSATAESLQPDLQLFRNVRSLFIRQCDVLRGGNRRSVGTKPSRKEILLNLMRISQCRMADIDPMSCRWLGIERRNRLGQVKSTCGFGFRW